MMTFLGTAALLALAASAQDNFLEFGEARDLEHADIAIAPAPIDMPVPAPAPIPGKVRPVRPGGSYDYYYQPPNKTYSTPGDMLRNGLSE